MQPLRAHSHARCFKVARPCRKFDRCSRRRGFSRSSLCVNREGPGSALLPATKQWSQTTTLLGATWQSTSHYVMHCCADTCTNMDKVNVTMQIRDNSVQLSRATRTITNATSSSFHWKRARRIGLPVSSESKTVVRRPLTRFSARASNAAQNPC